MQGILTSREAWTRFACALFAETDLSASQIAKESDQMLIQYLKRFPDPKTQVSAKLYRNELGVEDGVEFSGKRHLLTASSDDTPSPVEGS